MDVSLQNRVQDETTRNMENNHNLQNTTIANANAHILVDDENIFNNNGNIVPEMVVSDLIGDSSMNAFYDEIVVAVSPALECTLNENYNEENKNASNEALIAHTIPLGTMKVFQKNI